MDALASCIRSLEAVGASAGHIECLLTAYDGINRRPTPAGWVVLAVQSGDSIDVQAMDEDVARAAFVHCKLLLETLNYYMCVLRATPWPAVLVLAVDRHGIPYPAVLQTEESSSINSRMRGAA